MAFKIDPNQLAQISLFNELTEEQITQIARVMRVRSYKGAENILVEGEIGGEMFVLLEGELEITKRLTLYSSGETDQKNKSLIRLKASDNVFIGEMSMFGEEVRSATVIARTPVTLGVLTREHVRILSKKDPALGYWIFYNIGAKLSRALRRSNRDVLKLTTAFCLALEGK